MSRLIERDIFSEGFIDEETIFKLANTGVFSRLHKDAIKSCIQHEKPIGRLNEVLTREKILLHGIDPSDFVLVAGKQIGPLSPGLYFNVIVDDPSYKQNEPIDVYPLIYKYTSKKDIYICHYFPTHATLEAIFWNEKKERLEPIPSLLLEGKDAALLMRAAYTVLNQPIYELWADITNIETFKEVAGVRNTTINDLLKNQIKDRTFVVIEDCNNPYTIKFVQYRNNNFVQIVDVA